MGINDELMNRAREYSQRHSLVLGEHLGSGVHGIVFAAESQHEKGPPVLRSAIKVHEHQPDFRRERDVYLRLKAHSIARIRDCNVPQLLRYDDDLLILEMTVVTRPFVLDFAGAFLDKSPDFSDEVLSDWHTEKREQFGKRWPEVQAILGALSAYGIFMIDANPGNISFGDEQ